MEDRIKRLETIVDRLSRRSIKVATGLITPYPISAAKSGDNVQGDILNFMFPCDGFISKGAVMLGSNPKGSISMKIDIFNRDSATAREFNVDRIVTVIEPDLKVNAWDCMKISILADPEHPVTRIWASLLWTPAVKEVEAMRFLIDKLDEVKEAIQE